MKKLILITCLAFTVFACKKEAPVDYVLLSGTIVNADGNELTFRSADRITDKKITIKDDGTYSDTLRLKSTKFYISNGKNRVFLYLEKGNDIKVNFDGKDFDNTIKITGTGAEINNYYFNKTELKKELLGSGPAAYKLEETEFKDKITAVKSALNAKLDSTQAIADTFKAKEKRNINYGYLAMLNKYESYHKYYAKKDEFTVSENFLDDIKELKFDNTEDFVFSSDYKNIVSSHYSDLAQEAAKKDSIDYSEAYSTLINKIPTGVIKNVLLYDDAGFGITIAKDLDKYYNSFMAASTNEIHKEKVTESYTKLKAVENGKPSPKFANYENHAGGTISLDDLKGKYVYIDVWATWCGPCLREIPSLQKTEEAYHDKNIAFVSISVDDKDAHETWKKMVTDKELGGLQLFADNSFKSQFIEDYLIMGIPKFILLDTEGNIIDANAPRPSSDDLKTVLDGLNI